MNEKNLPNFAAWHRETLDKFALDAHQRVALLMEANEQLRLDLRDAMELLRTNLLDKKEPT